MFCYTTINSKLKYSMSTAVKQDLNFPMKILFSTKEMSIIRISNLVMRVPLARVDMVGTNHNEVLML